MRGTEVLRCHKLHVCGNDFVMVDFRRDARVPCDWAALAKQICRRKQDVGADELVILLPSTTADFALQIMNPDGSEAPMCGNALLASIKLVCDLDKKHGSEAFQVATANGVYRVAINGEGVCSAEMKGIEPGRAAKKVFLQEEGLTAFLLNTGAPHAVVPWDGMRRRHIEECGPRLENHPLLSPPTNVMFIEGMESGRLRMRAWERGGTGLSLACGTGACAAALVASSLTNSAFSHYSVECDGGTLGVSLVENTVLLMATPTYAFTIQRPLMLERTVLS